MLAGIFLLPSVGLDADPIFIAPQDVSGSSEQPLHGLITASQEKICLAPIGFLLKVFEMLLVSWVVFCLPLPLLSLWIPGTYKQLQQRLQTTVNGPWKHIAWDFLSQPETQRGSWKRFQSEFPTEDGVPLLENVTPISFLIFRVSGHLCILPPCCLPMLPMNVQLLMESQSSYSQSRISHCNRW